MSDELQVVADEIAEERVYTLRRAGYSVTDISEKLDLNPNAVVALYNSARMKMANQELSRDEVRKLLMERYEALLAANFDMALAGDADATKHVLSVLRDEMKLHHLDQLDPKDPGVTQNILIVGNDREAFIQALREGRQPVAVDESIEQEEDAHE